MSHVSIREQVQDELTGATSGSLKIGKIDTETPNKFPTSAEVRAAKSIEEGKPLPGKIVVIGKLMFPESLKKLLKEDEYLKNFSRTIVRELSAAEGSIGLLFLVLRGESTIERSEDLKTILDLQYFANLDVVTVQQTAGQSPDDYSSLFRYAERWMEQRGLDKPLMPILSSQPDRDSFQKYLDPLIKRGIEMLGVDSKGSFYYQTLRAIEELKRSRLDTWIHLFQTPPKVRFGRRLLPCSQGMILPMFGVDSYSRWVVPPPPEPLTKEKINLFSREDWGVYKNREWTQTFGDKLNCDCPICAERNLEKVFEGKVLSALNRSKTHDHYAQQGELEKVRESIRERGFRKLLESKSQPKSFLQLVPQQKMDNV